MIKDNMLAKYINDLKSAATGIVATVPGRKAAVSADSAMKKVVSRIMSVKKSGRKVIFIGNGGSSSIAGHQAVDYWKNGGIKAISFNDNALITCISNDFGYENVFKKPIERFASKGDILFAISSSGRSKNILNGVKAARRNGCAVITLSGFDAGNPLRGTGEINFYVPSRSYGIVEITHLALCHCALDHIIELGV